MIHPQAIVEEGAQIGKNVTIEPFAVVKKNVTLEDNVTIKAHAYIDGYTTIGEGTIIYPMASIGTKTQDLKYEGEKTYVKIGKKCEIREFVTINSSCGEGTSVEIGDECMLMAYCHVAHNCVIGRGVIMANCVNLAGHVIVEDYANIGGMTGVHQRVRIGAYAMVGGMSRTTHDVPPYTIGGGIPYKIAGLNVIGLKRRNVELKTRKALAQCFRLTYRSGLRLEEAVERIKGELEDLPQVQHWVDFCHISERGLIGLEGVAAE